MSLQPVWEGGGTLFNTASTLRSLMTVASKDDVQPQAVLAAEALGSLFIVSTKRVAEGIDALGGNDNVRFEAFMVTVGLDSGGIRRIVRKSHALVAIFLLISACKVCYIDEEIADMLFTMMSEAGIIQRYPVSSSQLHKLVGQLSGHANSIMPAEVLEEVARAIAPFHPDAGFYSRLGYKAFGELLKQIFDELRDDTVVSMQITGHDNGAWLATMLLWLFDLDASLAIEGQLIRGMQAAKVAIDLKLKNSKEPWSLLVFKEDSDITRHVYPYDHDERATLGRLPIVTTALYLDQHYWSNLHKADARRMAAPVCRVIVRILIETLLCRVNTTSTTQICSATVKELASVLSNPSATPLMEHYGWGPQDELETNFNKADIESCGQWLFNNLNVDMRDLKDGDVILTIGECIRTYFKHSLLGISFENVFDCVTISAVYVVLDLILTFGLVYNGNQCRRFVPPLSAELVQEQSRLLHSFIRGDVTPVRFFNEAMRRILPGSGSPQNGDLLVAYDGTVAGLGLFWDIDSGLKSILKLKMVYGHIRKDDFHYDKICEAYFQSFEHGKLLPLRFSTASSDKVPRVDMPRNMDQYEIENSVGASGRTLEIKQYISKIPSTIDTRTRRKISLKDAAFMLAMTERYAPTESGSLQSELAAEDRLTWLTPLHDLPLGYKGAHQRDSEKQNALLIPTWRDPMLVVAAAAAIASRQPSSPYDPPLRVLLHESGSVDASIQYALEKDIDVVIAL